MTKGLNPLIGCVALCVIALLFSARVVSQDKGGQEPAGGESMGEMMAAWAQLQAKGPEHKRFEEMVGTWETESKWWLAPESEPMISTGTAEFRLILDGRYVEQIYKCPNMMGMAYEGRGIEGYDNFKKKYVSLWMDSMSTGIYLAEGTVDASGKVWTYYGKMDDPFTGEKDKVAKSIAREISKDKVIYEMYDKKPGVGEFKTMEIIYTRKK